MITASGDGAALLWTELIEDVVLEGPVLRARHSSGVKLGVLGQKHLNCIRVPVVA